jgi:tRNA-dihydrouridine synthase
MVTSRALVERNVDTMQMVTFAEDEKPRSVQLYGVSPNVMAAAVKILIQEDRGMSSSKSHQKRWRCGPSV